MDGKELRARRRELGMTQHHFAHALGVSRVFLGLMERGAKPVAERTARIAASMRRPPLQQGPERTDPMERLIEEALIDAGINFSKEFQDAPDHRLDFHLTDLEIAIEVKRFHSPRAVAQLERYPNVIMVQGEKACRALAALIRNGSFPPA